MDFEAIETPMLRSGWRACNFFAASSWMGKVRSISAFLLTGNRARRGSSFLGSKESLDRGWPAYSTRRGVEAKHVFSKGKRVKRRSMCFAILGILFFPQAQTLGAA